MLLGKNNHTGTPADPTPVISKYAYTTNDIGQRETLVTTGSAFTTAPAYTWAYNATGELTQADDTSATNNDNAYAYDPIGNRLTWSVGVSPTATTTAYTTNALNQYTAVGSFNPTYDDDGNQLTAQINPLGSSSPTACYFHWDAENRLIKVTDLAQTTIAEYTYDYLSRRISKQSTINSIPTTTRWIYDGWNPITEYTGTTLSKSYLWGMDLSGSMQGAGGVGGLLSVSLITNNPITSNSYFPTYDGNGNVSEYLDSSGAVAAHYEYDPFGRTTVATGAKAQDFSHRFSTKPLDEETGLYYYTYRHYDPLTGRWPSRDPIEERGGMNLYEFVRNCPSGLVDKLGKDIIIIIGCPIPGGVNLGGHAAMAVMGHGVFSWGTTDLDGTPLNDYAQSQNNTRSQCFYWIPATKEEDVKAIEAFKKEREKGYSILKQQTCASACCEGLKEIGVFKNSTAYPSMLKQWFDLGLARVKNIKALCVCQNAQGFPLADFDGFKGEEQPAPNPPNPYDPSDLIYISPYIPPGLGLDNFRF